MMELYIQIRDGQPFEHPIFGDNFREAFPHVDVNNLPPKFAKFERVERPYKNKTFEEEVYSYQWVDGVVKDVWHTRPMTEDEKIQKQIEIVNNTNMLLDDMKTRSRAELNKAPDDEARAAWIAFIEVLDSWRLVDFDNINFPVPPQLNADGTLKNLNAAGSAPDVIG